MQLGIRLVDCLFLCLTATLFALTTVFRNYFLACAFGIERVFLIKLYWRTGLSLVLLVLLLSDIECQNYRNLTYRNRKITYGLYWYALCDWRLSGWYRFSGAAGRRMATSCPPTERCGSFATGWLYGNHPAVADGQVSRWVCFHWNSDCCLWSRSIKVRNCGAYYVYYLRSTPACYLRYCSTD